jgi:hypothetical protein
MQTRNRVAPVPRKQRNPVVLGLLRRVITAAAGRHRSRIRLTRRQQEDDLAQRVRDIGEW